MWSVGCEGSRWLEESQEVTLVKGRRHSPEQVVRKLREADRLLAEGGDVAGVCRHLKVSVQTYQRWRSQYKAMRRTTWRG
jgi:Transposase